MSVGGVANLAHSGLSATVGRQDLVLGDGFLIGDGVRDNKAALWNIPLNYFDAARLEWTRGVAHALAFGTVLSSSWYPRGANVHGRVLGGEAGWAPAPGSDLTATYLNRADREHHDAIAYALRGSWSRGRASAAGEAVLEDGRELGVPLGGRGGHAWAQLKSAGRLAPFARVEYFHFSGDDPTTAKNETYDPWFYRWSDWGHYYVGELVSATVGDETNMRIWVVQLGATPRAGTDVRLLAHRMNVDTFANLVKPASGSTRFADEIDVVLEQSAGAHWSGWVMGAWATPLDVARVNIGTASCGQVFASVTFKFGNATGDSD
jgi:hypothetical protein